MGLYQKYYKLINGTGVVVFISGIGWVVAQVHKTYRALNNVLDTSVIHFLEPMKHDESILEADNTITLNWGSEFEESQKSRSVTKPRSEWLSLKYAYARRLLNMTKSNNSLVRRRAVMQLAKANYLDNWHYSLLAHMVTGNTAIALARCENAETRFFIPRPLRYLTYDHNMIVHTAKELLIALNKRSNHPCMAYFIEKAFFDQEADRFVDHESAMTELKKLIKSADDILPLCLESLLHHSSIKDYAKDIVLLNGLPLLMEIHNRFKDNVEINVILSNILSNISMFPEFLEDIHRSGWIGVLAQWIKQNDIRISAPAARALANLDIDDELHAMYPQKVYVLHPLFHSDQDTLVDVIFVHGLLGGIFYTWRQRNDNEATVGFLETLVPDTNTKFMKSSDPAIQEYLEDLQLHQEIEWEQLGQDFEFVLHDIPTQTNENAAGPYTCYGNHQCILQQSRDSANYTYCWPKDWLPEDCKHLRVLGISYDTSLSMWSPMCPSENPKQTLEDRSNELTEKLLKAGVGQRPIVWVTHSMGGLLVKNMLCKAWNSNSEELRKLCSNTKGIVFYSTPHSGSRLATLSQPTTIVLWPSVEIQELRQESPMLLDIHNKFLNLAKQSSLKIISFVETKSTQFTAMKFNFLLVDRQSANPSIGEVFEIPQDHLGICKPANRQSFLYQKVLNLIKQIVEAEKRG